MLRFVDDIFDLHSETIVISSRIIKQIENEEEEIRRTTPKDDDRSSFQKGVDKLKALLKQKPGKKLHVIEKEFFKMKMMVPLFQSIKKVFEPQIISFNQYRNWRISCWMEIEKNQRQAGLNYTKTSAELLKIMTPCLEQCDLFFKKCYRRIHGLFSIKKLRRLQSFVTRYRPRPKESALLRHVDGMLVDGSIVVGLPTDETFTGGGLTIWDGHPDNPDATYKYPMGPGDICFLDHLVWHQANPIASGERWALVIFYSVKRDNNDACSGEKKKEKK
jgi:hypothetical protein